jgi:hypothetical protein
MESIQEEEKVPPKAQRNQSTDVSSFHFYKQYTNTLQQGDQFFFLL